MNFEQLKNKMIFRFFASLLFLVICEWRFQNIFLVNLFILARNFVWNSMVPRGWDGDLEASENANFVWFLKRSFKSHKFWPIEFSVISKYWAFLALFSYCLVYILGLLPWGLKCHCKFGVKNSPSWTFHFFLKEICFQ